MTDRFAAAEWRLDCMNSRMDALERRDAYNEREQEEAQRKFPKGSKVRPNRQGAKISTVVRVNLPMVVTTDGEYHWTKLVRADRADADDPCWAGYEQRGTKEKNGRTVPNCVKADASVPSFSDWLASRGYKNYVVAPRMTEKLREKYAGNFTQAEYTKLKDEYRKINPSYF